LEAASGLDDYVGSFPETEQVCSEGSGGGIGIDREKRGKNEVEDLGVGEEGMVTVDSDDDKYHRGR